MIHTNPVGMILELQDFVDTDLREQEILTAFSESGSYLIVDLSALRVGAPEQQFQQVAYFVKVVAEHLRRRARELPRTVFCLPEPSRAILDRLQLLADQGGFSFEMAASLERAKACFGEEIDWLRVNLSSETE